MTARLQDCCPSCLADDDATAHDPTRTVIDGAHTVASYRCDHGHRWRTWWLTAWVEGRWPA